MQSRVMTGLFSLQLNLVVHRMRGNGTKELLKGRQMHDSGISEVGMTLKGVKHAKLFRISTRRSTELLLLFVLLLLV